MREGLGFRSGVSSPARSTQVLGVTPSNSAAAKSELPNDFPLAPTTIPHCRFGCPAACLAPAHLIRSSHRPTTGDHHGTVRQWLKLPPTDAATIVLELVERHLPEAAEARTTFHWCSEACASSWRLT